MVKLKQIMDNLWQKIKKQPYLFSLIGLIIIFTPIYFYLPTQFNDQFYSPDETANFYFAKSFADKNQLKIYEPLNEFGANIVFPRSINVTPKHELVSGSFLGLPIIYGLLAKIFSTGTIVYFTPILSLFSILFLFFGLKNIAEEKIAFWSSALALVLPNFIYSANKGLLPQNLLIFFSLSCFYLLTLAKIKRNDFLLIPSALFLSLALFVRTSEIFFLGFLLLAFWFIYERKTKFLIYFGIPLLLGLFGILSINKLVYGSYFSLGYQALENTAPIAKNTFSKILGFLLPFGHNLSTVFVHIREYLWKILFPIFIPAILGLLMILNLSSRPKWRDLLYFCSKQISPLAMLGRASAEALLGYTQAGRNDKEKNAAQNDNKKVACRNDKKDNIQNDNKKAADQNYNIFFAGLIIFFTIIYELIFYGAFSPWGLSGLPKDLQSSIGSPHLRYFLPMLFLLIPFWVIFFTKLIKTIKQKWQKPFIIFSIFFFLIFSLNMVFDQTGEGLLKIKNDLTEFSTRLETINNVVPKNSLLIVPEWADRIFFPTYQVIQSINDPKIHAKDPITFLPKILQNTKIFYYSSEGFKDIETLTKKLNEQNIDLKFLQTIFKDENLYVLEPSK